MVKCRQTGCVKKASHGKAYRKPLFCKPHSAPGDRNVTHKRCESHGCLSVATFGLEWRRPLFCGKHRSDGCVDVIHKRCAHSDCLSRPVFGLVWNKPITCGAHKQDGYEDVVNTRCSYDGCLTRPSFGLTWGKPVSCGEHKQAGYDNVVDKRCETDGCSNQAIFGRVFRKPISCGTHQLDGYNDVIHKHCGVAGCPTQPRFGLVWGTPLSCRGHSQKNYFDVASKKCGSSACIVFPMIERGRGRYRIDGALLCGKCLRNEHPDLAKKFKVRTEHFVLAELQRRMPELEDNFLSWDCPLPCAISTERADILWQIGSTLLHVEVDETATHEDDRNRLMRLLAGTDAVDHIVVRIHTHSYDNFKPCVTRSQLNGEWVVSCRKKEFDRRMDIVVPEIKKLLAAKKSTVKVMFLS